MIARTKMSSLGDQLLMDAGDHNAIAATTDSLTSAGLVIGVSSAAAVKIANTVTYKILGKFFSKTTAEIAFTATAANNLANGQEQVYMLTLDSAGNGLLIPGGVSNTQGQAPLPERPEAVLALTTAAIVAGTVTVGVSNTNNMVAGQSITVDVGGNAETITLTSFDPVANTITATFANNHPANTPIKWVTCPIGHVRIWTGGSSTFTAGTTLLSATGLVVTYTNGYPRPLWALAQ